jgi:Flp pilus assembly protein TadG
MGANLSLTIPETLTMTGRFRRRESRRGIVVVEAAMVLPVLLILMFGMWEVARIVQVNQVMVNACREGARLAAGGYTNGTPVTSAMVQQAVRDYLTASTEIPATAVTNATVTLTCLASPAWTDPSAALPLDAFRVTLTIPAGTAFNSLRWSVVNQLTSARSLTTTVYWQSLNNSQVVVNTTLPY